MDVRPVARASGSPNICVLVAAPDLGFARCLATSRQPRLQEKEALVVLSNHEYLALMPSNCGRFSQCRYPDCQLVYQKLEHCTGSCVRHGWHGQREWKGHGIKYPAAQ